VSTAPRAERAGRPPVAHIRRRAHGEDLSYEALREQGIALAQAASGVLWTDYNLHDPGVTLLEALSFALTSGVYLSELPVSDLLAADDGQLHYHRHGLHAPTEILPCRPTTADDLRLALLDRIPSARDVRVAMPSADGCWQMALHAGADAQPALRAELARASWALRNLGEDFDGLPQQLAVRECQLEAELAIDGPRDPADVVVDLIERCAREISAPPARQSLRQRLVDSARTPFSTLLEGPLPRHGWLQAGREQDPEQALYFSDLARLARSIDGVVDVSSLRLRGEDIPIHADAIERRGEHWALQLRWPRDAAELDWLRVSRRGTVLKLPAATVLRRLEYRREQLARHGFSGEDRVLDRLLPENGQPLPPQPYVPAYRHLPPIYHGASNGSLLAAERQTQRGEHLQFAGYLALVEQWLAHGEAQIQQLRQLYTIAPDARSSYAWQMLDEQQLPGLDTLYARPAAAIRAEIFAGIDDPLERRSRILDHLLALHGEGWGQSSIRAFGWYYSADAWRRQLYRHKYRLLARIVRHTRDRAAAIDYSRPAFDRRGNTAPLQERVSLLLAFSQAHSRSLFGGLRRYRLRLLREDAAVSETSEVAPEGIEPIALWSAARVRIEATLSEDDAQLWTVIGRYLPALAGVALAPALLRCAVHSDRYHCDREGGLWLGPDEQGRWWPFVPAKSAPPIDVVAMRLHQFACRLQRDAEGLHLIEHLPLRPTRPDAATPPDEVPETFYRQRISAVFPAWTARCADPTFRALAEETLTLCAPAHLLVEALWLDAGALLEMEDAYRAWLNDKRAYCHALLSDSNADAAAVDRSAGILRRLLWRHLAATGVRS